MSCQMTLLLVYFLGGKCYIANDGQKCSFYTFWPTVVFDSTFSTVGRVLEQCLVS